MSAPENQPVATPPGLHQAWRFAMFNGISFQIVLGGPMILYAKSLHASATVLGIIVGMMPLMVMLQIPAASFINRIGYKRFVLAGWSSRTLFVVGLALVPLVFGFLDATTRLVLVLMMLFGFNVVRGISSCAWLPWIAGLVPEHFRGRYFSRDAAMTNLGCFCSTLIAAAVLGGAARPWQFAVAFAFSAAMGITSLAFLKRMPDVPITEEARSSREPVPWLAMLRHSPFQKLLRAVVVWSVAFGGMTAFTIAFLKSETGMADGKILLITSVFFLGGMSSVQFLGHRLDHLGSKPVLGFSFVMWLVILAGWIAIAGGVLLPGLPFVLALQFLMGLFAALVNMANNRLAMAIIPPLGRNHFFALYSVFGNVALGLAPVGWGLLIDAVGTRHGELLGVEWNRYSIFFAAVAMVVAVAFTFVRRLDEPKAASLEALVTEILIESPQRLWLRFWPRE